MVAVPGAPARKAEEMGVVAPLRSVDDTSCHGVDHTPPVCTQYIVVSSGSKVQSRHLEGSLINS